MESSYQSRFTNRNNKGIGKQNSTKNEAEFYSKWKITAAEIINRFSFLRKSGVSLDGSA